MTIIVLVATFSFCIPPLNSLLFTVFSGLLQYYVMAQSQWAHYSQLLKSHTSIFFVIAYTFIILCYVPYQ
jgi:hypothetical protein